MNLTTPWDSKTFKNSVNCWGKIKHQRRGKSSRCRVSTATPASSVLKTPQFSKVSIQHQHQSARTGRSVASGPGLDIAIIINVFPSYSFNELPVKMKKEKKSRFSRREFG